MNITRKSTFKMFYSSIFSVVWFPMLSEAASQCLVEVSSYGYSDPSGCQVYFRLNGNTSHLRSQDELGLPDAQYRGFHLAYMDARSCQLISEPVVCDTYDLPSGSPCVIDVINNYTGESPDVFLLVGTGMINFLFNTACIVKETPLKGTFIW